MESVLYVSTSLLDPALAEQAVAQIVADSIARNRDRGITGAMIYTGTHFAQIIEGPSESIAALMRSLRADPRQTNIVVIEHVPLSKRRFSEWNMAYSGPSQFIGRQVSRVLNDPSPAELRRAAGWLIDVMLEFVAR